MSKPKCPSCGACQECGARPNPYPVYPWTYPYPYTNPPYWQRPYTTWGSGTTNVPSTSSNPQNYC